MPGERVRSWQRMQEEGAYESRATLARGERERERESGAAQGLKRIDCNQSNETDGRTVCGVRRVAQRIPARW